MLLNFRLVKTLLDKGAVATKVEDCGDSELMVAICRNWSWL